jgi:hypothetical protein
MSSNNSIILAHNGASSTLKQTGTTFYIKIDLAHGISPKPIPVI